jgi:hypothetical protein
MPSNSASFPTDFANAFRTTSGISHVLPQLVREIPSDLTTSTSKWRMEQGPNPGSWQLHHRCAIQTQTRVGPLNRAFQRSSTTADHDNNADPVHVRGEKRWLVSLVVA